MFVRANADVFVFGSKNDRDVGNEMMCDVVMMKIINITTNLLKKLFGSAFFVLLSLAAI